MSVFVPEESRRATQVGSKEARQRTRPLGPAVRAYSVELPAGEDALGGSGGVALAEALLAALAAEHGLRGLTVEPAATEALTRLAGESHAALTAMIWQGDPEGEALTGDARHAGAGAVLDVRPATHPGPCWGWL